MIDDLALFITQGALREVMRHLGSDPDKELLGFLIGELYECPETSTRYLVVNAAIRTGHVIPEEEPVQIPEEEWLGVQLEVRRRRALLAGWYHSAPFVGGHPTRLDLDTHRARFTEPWQAGLVIATSGNAPTGAFFRPLPGGPEAVGVHIPFHELLDVEAFLDGGRKRTLIDWVNYSTDALVERDTSERRPYVPPRNARPGMPPGAPAAAPGTGAGGGAGAQPSPTAAPAWGPDGPIWGAPAPAPAPAPTPASTPPGAMGEPGIPGGAGAAPPPPPPPFPPLRSPGFGSFPGADAGEGARGAPSSLPVMIPGPSPEWADDFAAEPPPMRRRMRLGVVAGVLFGALAAGAGVFYWNQRGLPELPGIGGGGVASAPAAPAATGSAAATGPGVIGDSAPLPSPMISTDSARGGERGAPDSAAGGSSASGGAPESAAAGIGDSGAAGSMRGGEGAAPAAADTTAGNAGNIGDNLDADAAAAGAAAPPSSDPRVRQFDSLADSLDHSIRNFNDRAQDFSLQRLTCRGLGVGYRTADETFISLATLHRSLADTLDTVRLARYRSLVGKMERVNRAFDDSKCERP